MRLLKIYRGMIILGILLVLFPLLVTDDYGLNVAIFALQNIIVVTGLNLLMGYAGQISLGHAGFIGLGAYTSAVLTTTLGVNCWLAMIIAAVLVGIVAFLIALPTLKLKGHYLAMATLGMGIILYIVFNQLVEVTGGPSGFVGIPFMKIGGSELSSYHEIYIVTALFTFLVVLISYNLTLFRIGRALRSIHQSETASTALGINTYVYKVQVFVLSAIFASIAGSLYAHTVTFISPTSFGFKRSIQLVTMVIVGGMGNIWGGVIGALFLTYLPEFLRAFEDYDIILYGILLILVIIYLPSGIVGGVEKIYERIPFFGSKRSK